MSRPAGVALEPFLRELFDTFDLDPKASFKISGEQIDGGFTLDSECSMTGSTCASCCAQASPCCDDRHAGAGPRPSIRLSTSVGALGRLAFGGRVWQKLDRFVLEHCTNFEAAAESGDVAAKRRQVEVVLALDR